MGGETWSTENDLIPDPRQKIIASPAYVSLPRTQAHKPTRTLTLALSKKQTHKKPNWTIIPTTHGSLIGPRF